MVLVMAVSSNVQRLAGGTLSLRGKGKDILMERSCPGCSWDLLLYA